MDTNMKSARVACTHIVPRQLGRQTAISSWKNLSGTPLLVNAFMPLQAQECMKTESTNKNVWKLFFFWLIVTQKCFIEAGEIRWTVDIDRPSRTECQYY